MKNKIFSFSLVLLLTISIGFSSGVIEVDEGENSNNNQEETESSSEQSSNNGNSGGGSGGGGGGGSSGPIFFNDREVDESSAYIPKNSCIPSYIYTVWSKCLDGEQSRTVTDLNSCKSDRDETRICNGDDDLENLFLNAKEISLERIAPFRYSTNLGEGYKEIFSLSQELEEDVFILIDEDSGVEYLSRIATFQEGKYYYTIEEIDQEVLLKLEEEGLLKTKKTFGEKVKNYFSSENAIILTIIGLLFFLSMIIIFLIFYIKKINHTKPTISEHLQKVKGDFDSYVNRVKGQLTKEQIKNNFIKAGWEPDLVNEYFKLK